MLRGKCWLQNWDVREKTTREISAPLAWSDLWDMEWPKWREGTSDRGNNGDKAGEWVQRPKRGIPRPYLQESQMATWELEIVFIRKCEAPVCSRAGCYYSLSRVKFTMIKQLYLWAILPSLILQIYLAFIYFLCLPWIFHSWLSFRVRTWVWEAKVNKD